MAWSVFRDTLWHSRLSIFLWGLGLMGMMAVSVQAIPLMSAMDMTELLEAFPPWMRNFLGITDFEILTKPEAMVALGFFGKLALIVAAYPVVMGLRVTASEESDGMMDVVLSQPVSRSRVLIEKFLAYTVSILIVMAMVIGGIYLGNIGLTVEYNSFNLVLVTISIIPVMIFLLALTAFIGTLVRRYRTAMMIVTGYIIASFAFQVVGSAASQEWFSVLKNFFIFNYFGVEHTLKDGLSFWNMAVMLVLAALFLGASLYQWEERDIAV
jgi:ABC-2 type transport system permease protein